MFCNLEHNDIFNVFHLLVTGSRVRLRSVHLVNFSDPDNSLHFNSFLARGYLPLQNTEIFSTVRNRKISLGKCLISFTFRPEHTLRVHVRTVSARRF